MKPLVKKKLFVEKYTGKGGWTFVRVPKLPKGIPKVSGYVRVKGTVDGYAISKYSLMPMKDGKLFLPLNTAMRKSIGKEAGATVEVILYVDTDPLTVPGELLICLADDPAALRFFNTLTESNKRYYIEWIYSAKRETTKVERMAKTIGRLARGLKMYDVGS